MNKLKGTLPIIAFVVAAVHKVETSLKEPLSQIEIKYEL